MKKLTVIFLGLLTVEAFANNQFIPNHYRNRRMPNQQAAIGWSTRNEVNGYLEAERADEKTAGTKTEESKTNTAMGLAFLRLNEQWNLEMTLAAGKSESEDFNPSAPTDSAQMRLGTLGVGYEFEGRPMAIGGFVASSRTDYEFGSTGTKDHIRTEFASFGLGYHLPSDIYLGAGVFTAWSDHLAADDLVFAYSVGAGKVFGDKKNPEATTEAVLTFINDEGTQSYALSLRGLKNQGSLQFYGQFNYGISEGNEPADELGLLAGLDYLLESGIYFGPQMSISVDNTDDAASADTKGSELSLEAGYRQGPFEAYARLARETEKSEDSFVSDQDEVTGTLTVGGTYFF